jgi:hypothetical protein
MSDKLIAVKNLCIGDRVDLENDPYADTNSDDIDYDCEYAVVCGIVRESPSCIAVEFDGFGVIGFPPDHMIKWVGTENNH